LILRLITGIEIMKERHNTTKTDLVFDASKTNQLDTFFNFRVDRHILAIKIRTQQLSRKVIVKVSH